MRKSNNIDLLVCHSERSYVPLFVIQSVAMNHIPYTNVWGGDPSFRSASFWMTILSFFVIQSEAMNPIPEPNLMGMSPDIYRGHYASLRSG